MVYITGDTHGDMKEFSQRMRPYKLSEDDILIITGDFGFDWDERSQVWDKVREEVSEFTYEAQKHDHDRMEAEFGDVLFSLINAARLYKINPENALERTNQKFIARFNYLESKAHEMGRELRDMTLAEMDAIWEEAKTKV